MLIATSPNVKHEDVHVDLTISRPAAGVAIIVIRNTNVGEFGDYAMHELDKDLAKFDRLALFIDTHAVKNASIEVSSE